MLCFGNGTADASLNYKKRAASARRFVYGSLPRDEVFEQVERWGLDQHLESTAVS